MESIFPDKSSKLLIVNPPCRLNIPIIPCCKQVCINKQWVYDFCVGPITLRIPEGLYYFDISSWVRPQSMGGQELSGIISGINCHELRLQVTGKARGGYF